MIDIVTEMIDLDVDHSIISKRNDNGKEIGMDSDQILDSSFISNKDSSFLNVSLSLSIYSKILIGSILVLIILVSILGNLLVCVAIASDRRLRRLGNLFLVSLAIADLCVGALVMTFALANDLMEYWPFWPQLCEIWIAFDISCSTCSIINLCAIALDRFAHIKDPMVYNRWMNKRIVVISVSMIWLVSGLISFVPISLGWHRPSPLNSSTTAQIFETASTIASFKIEDDSDENFMAKDLNDTLFHRLKRFKRHSKHHHRIKNFDLDSTSSLFHLTRFNFSPIYSLPVPLFPDETNNEFEFDAYIKQQQNLAQKQVINSNPYNDDELSLEFSRSKSTMEFSEQYNRLMIPSSELIIPLYSDLPISSQRSQSRKASIFNIESSLLDGDQLRPHCSLDLTPTYAVVSSCISFYFPCLIMLCLYARLYSICQRHVRSIKSMTKMRTFIGSSDQFEEIEDGIAHRNEVAIRNSKKSTNQIRKKNVPMNEIVNCRKQEYLHGNVQHQNQHHQQQSHVSEHKAAITLGIIMGTFLTCWMPFFCMNIVAAFCKTCIPDSVFKILTWLGYFNSSLNPAIYSIFNTEFRDAFKRILVRYVFSSDVRKNCNRCCRVQTCRAKTFSTIPRATENTSNNPSNNNNNNSNTNNNNNAMTTTVAMCSKSKSNNIETSTKINDTRMDSNLSKNSRPNVEKFLTVIIPNTSSSSSKKRSRNQSIISQSKSNKKFKRHRQSSASNHSIMALKIYQTDRGNPRKKFNFISFYSFDHLPDNEDRPDVNLSNEIRICSEPNLKENRLDDSTSI
ncbi:Dopamine receptor 1 [Sarcoptes scabiei]|uniref:Dopamine receptor 1 n=1 Tax=Sarcoptes scabiei TaxID=52283 RepID=A0A834RDN2_SARSC|nr:Dopamine receptor 1 [Sarcoptes scabiei]